MEKKNISVSYVIFNSIGTTLMLQFLESLAIFIVLMSTYVTPNNNVCFSILLHWDSSHPAANPLDIGESGTMRVFSSSLNIFATEHIAPAHEKN